MKHLHVLLICVVSFGWAVAHAQGREDRRPAPTTQSILKATSPLDRGQSVLQINKLGNTVTNMGQFHAFSGTLPSGRWPMGTDHDQLYRMNMYVGIPGNVVSTRARNTKEWDPVPGLHAPGVGKIALSTDQSSWPLDGQGIPYWPIRTVDGRDSIISQEDSYAEYRDLTNMRVSSRLNILVRQTTYGWSTSKDQDYTVMKFTLVNDTTASKDSLYFALYTDFDAGGMTNDYLDDLWGFDAARQFYYIYDADGISNDWGAGNPPFYLGIVFLETPLANGRRLGITDWHYSSDGDSPWGDVLNEDAVLFDWMSSNPSLKNNATWPNLFHGSNIKIDDVGQINPAGERLDAIAASGPYHMAPHDSITFIVAMVAGKDLADIQACVDRVRAVYQNGLRLVPPPKPTVHATAQENRVQLSWSNAEEFTYVDPSSGKKLVKQYNVYRTSDPDRKSWGTPYAVIPRDTTKTAVDSMAYVWRDSVDIRNFNFYSYSVTVLDVDSLESGKAFLPADKSSLENTVEVRPVNTPQQGLEAIRVVPNPYIISASWERKRLGDPLLGEPVRDIAFTNLPAQCTIRIYTLDGDLVKTIEHVNGTGTEFWDLRSYANQLVATGVYFYHVASETGERISKFAIVR